MVMVDCSEPVLNQEAVDMVERILPDTIVPRFSKSPVLHCLRIFKPYTQNILKYMPEIRNVHHKKSKSCHFLPKENLFSVSLTDCYVAPEDYRSVQLEQNHHESPRWELVSL